MNLFYKKFVEEKRDWYKKIGKCYCPILKVEVIFNSKGFRHLLYDGLGRSRSVKEQIHRLSLLPLALLVIELATSITEHKKSEYSKILNKRIEYWMLQEIVGNQGACIVVILRKVGDGNVIFYSVWKKRDKNNASKKPS